MKSKASILIIALFLFSSVLAEESFHHVAKDQNGLTDGELKHTTTTGGTGGHSAGFSHGGVYGAGQFCKFGCCNKSFGYSHKGGGYYSCTCCATAAEAEAYKESQAKAQIMN